jgi:hypothetical protein
VYFFFVYTAQWLVNIYLFICVLFCDKWVPVTTAWRALRLRVERPPGMKGSCEYVEYAAAESRQGMVLQLRGWVTC